ncbi:MAG: hypothetical protein Q8K18_13550 [Burkholderiales bacterium]|nr:hypothetical protein [Burkholderiales bacterium]
MDSKLKKRIYAFYFAGVVNLVLGMYVLVAGGSMMPRGTVLLLVFFFFGFAAVDFYFPKMLKKKWDEQQKQLEVQQRKSAEVKSEE